MEKKDELDELLHPKMGVFNPSIKFAFTNITEEPFDIVWDGALVTRVEPNITVELPHYLAVKCTKELVDKIMIANAKLNEVEFYKNNPNVQINTYRAPNSLGVPSARKVWEKQIVRILEVDESSPQVRIIRAQVKEELLKDLNAQPSKGSPLDNAPGSVTEFADLTKKEEKKAPDEKKSEVKVKKVK